MPSSLDVLFQDRYHTKSFPQATKGAVIGSTVSRFIKWRKARLHSCSSIQTQFPLSDFRACFRVSVRSKIERQRAVANNWDLATSGIESIWLLFCNWCGLFHSVLFILPFFLGILIWVLSAKRREFREKNFEKKTNFAGSIWSIVGNLYIVWNRFLISSISNGLEDRISE